MGQDPSPDSSARAARGLPARGAQLLDAIALAFAVAWALRATLGAWSWPFPMLLHAWALAAPAFAVGAVAALLRRKAGPVLLHALLLALWLAQHGARFAPGDEPGADGLAPGELTLVSLNVGNGRAAPDELARWALASEADVLLLQELGAEQAAALERACAERYPWRTLRGTGLHGMGVLARVPLEGVRELWLADGSLALVGTLEVGARRVAFADVHLSAWAALLGPWGGSEAGLAAVVRELEGAPVALIAGDFNLTGESPLLDGAREAGYADAFEEAGVGLGLSFPVFGRYRGLPLPPLVRIDHILLRGGLRCAGARVLAGAGSDHRALEVRCAWSASE